MVTRIPIRHLKAYRAWAIRAAMKTYFGSGRPEVSAEKVERVSPAATEAAMLNFYNVPSQGARQDG